MLLATKNEVTGIENLNNAIEAFNNADGFVADQMDAYYDALPCKGKERGIHAAFCNILENSADLDYDARYTMEFISMNLHVDIITA